MKLVHQQPSSIISGWFSYGFSSIFGCSPPRPKDSEAAQPEGQAKPKVGVGGKVGTSVEKSHQKYAEIPSEIPSDQW